MKNEKSGHANDDNKRGRGPTLYCGGNKFPSLSHIFKNIQFICLLRKLFYTAICKVVTFKPCLRFSSSSIKIRLRTADFICTFYNTLFHLFGSSLCGERCATLFALPPLSDPPRSSPSKSASCISYRIVSYRIVSTKLRPLA